MSAALVNDRPNRARALELIGGVAPTAPYGHAGHIVGHLAVAVGTTVEHAVRYASHGAVLDAEFGVEHIGADGSKTRASLRVRYGKNEAALAASNELEQLISAGLLESKAI